MQECIAEPTGLIKSPTQLRAMGGLLQGTDGATACPSNGHFKSWGKRKPGLELLLLIPPLQIPRLASRPVTRSLSVMPLGEMHLYQISVSCNFLSFHARQKCSAPIQHLYLWVETLAHSWQTTVSDQTETSCMTQTSHCVQACEHPTPNIQLYQLCRNVTTSSQFKTTSKTKEAPKELMLGPTVPPRPSW